MYLGILFKGKHGRKGGTHEAGERQCVAAIRASHALWKRCYEMDLANANILSYLYLPIVDQSKKKRDVKTSRVFFCCLVEL